MVIVVRENLYNGEVALIYSIRAESYVCVRVFYSFRFKGMKLEILINSFT